MADTITEVSEIPSYPLVRSDPAGSSTSMDLTLNRKLIRRIMAAQGLHGLPAR